MTDFRTLEDMRRRETELRLELDRHDATWAGRQFDDEAREAWNSLNSELDELRATIEETERRTARIGELAKDPRNIEPIQGPEVAGPQLRAATQAALRTIERHQDVTPAESGDRLDKVVRYGDPQGLLSHYIAAVGADAYRSAFTKMLRDPVMGHLRFSPQEVEAVRRVGQVEVERAISTTTTGVPIPYQLDPTIILGGTGALNPFRQICRTEVVSEGTWKGVVNTADVSLAYSAEAAEAADNSPTLAQPSITTQRCIGFVPFSIESQQDWSSAEQELAGVLRDAKDVLDASAFLTGTGSNQPGGILNIGGTGGLTTTQRVQTATTATYVVGDPYLLKAALPARFVNTSTWAGAPATWDSTFRFVGGNSTEPLQMPTRGGDMLGRPKVEISTMGTGTTTSTKLFILGDFKAGYLIADRLGMSVELIPHLFGATNRFPTGQRGLVAIWRTGGGVLAANALRYLEVK